MARGLKIRIYELEGLYYLSSENKSADQLRGHREADLRLCFRIYMQNFCFLTIRLKSKNCGPSRFIWDLLGITVKTYILFMTVSSGY